MDYFNKRDQKSALKQRDTAFDAFHEKERNLKKLLEECNNLNAGMIRAKLNCEGGLA